MFIFYFVYTKQKTNFTVIGNENKEVCVANLMINYIFSLLRIDILGSSF